jgi:adenine phosphoribosyltransferase
MPHIVKSKIRTIPHWPKQGVMFRDITTLLKDSEGFKRMIGLLVERYKGMEIDSVAGIESRGFITGSVLAHQLGVGFIPIRKPGKLPAETVSEEYELEYGKDKIEIHKDAIHEGSKVLLVDDLIATGGTAMAACSLLKKLGADIVECSFIVDLPELGGKKKLTNAGYKAFSLVEFEGE